MFLLYGSPHKFLYAFTLLLLFYSTAFVLLYLFCFTLLILFYTTALGFVRWFGFRLLLWFSSTAFVLYYGFTLG